MSVKKLESLALFYSGKSRTFIRNKLNVRSKRLNKWIDNDTRRSVKDMAFLIHYYKLDRTDFCSKYLVSDIEFDYWIKSEYEINKVLMYLFRNYIIQCSREIYKQMEESKKLKEPTKIVPKDYKVPNGYSSWTNNIIQKGRRCLS